MPFLIPRSLLCTPPFTQGHVEAAACIGAIYYWGQGVVVDHNRALAAYKIGAEGGNAYCQNQLGSMYYLGRGIDSPDYKQAVVWLEKAAAQGQANALNNLGVMADQGLGQQPSWRRAREHYQRAIELGYQRAIPSIQGLDDLIQKVTRSHAGDNSGLRSLPHPPPHPAPVRPPHGPEDRGLRHHPSRP